MKPVTTDDVFDLMDAYITSAALNAAMELGLFWLLAEQPLDTAHIAQALGIPTNRCGYWLELLKSTGLIDETTKGHVPSSAARTAILDVYSQDTWAFLAREAQERFPAVRDLALHIHETGSAWEAQGLAPPDYFTRMVEDPERARRFTRMLYEIHLPLAKAVAESLDMRGVDRLMDLGGGSGVMSLALLRRYPHLTAVVVDIANVCAAGREIVRDLADADSVKNRITYHAADFLRDELPSGFGMVLQCDAGPASEALLRKIRRALNPGGRLVIIDHFAPAEGVAPPAWLYWAFAASLESPDFSLLTVAEVQSRLKQAGFQFLSERTLPPKEMLRWSIDWIMIESYS